MIFNNKKEDKNNCREEREEDVELIIAENKTSYLAWIELACIVLLNMSVNLRWLTFSPVASISASYMNVTISSITWLSNCATLIYIAIGGFTGWVFERYGMKTCLLLAGGTNVLGSWIRYFGSLAPVHQRYPVIMFGQCLASIAEPFIMNVGTHFAAVWFSSHHRVTANSLQALPLGMIVATLSMPKLVTVPGELPRALLITAGISTAFGIPFLFLPSGPKVPPTQSSTVVRTTFKQSFKTLLRNRNYILLLVSFSIYFCLFASVVSITSYIFTAQGYNTVEAGYASFVRIISGVVGAVVAGRITDYTGKHVIVLKVSAIMNIITFVILYIQDLRNSYPFVMISCFLNGLFVFLMIPVSLELAAECTFPVSESVSASILWLACQIASFCTTYIMDALRAGPDANPPYNMKHALIYAVVLACVGAIPTLFLKSDLKRIDRDVNNNNTSSGSTIEEATPSDNNNEKYQQV